MSILAKEIMHLDHEIDEMEVEIEEECLKIIALHQPVATDLRFLIAVIKINNDLERIGDQVVNIAQRVVSIAKRPVAPYQFDYSVMADKAEGMLRMSLDSLVNQDLDLAIKVLHLDDEVDAIKDEAYDRHQTGHRRRCDRRYRLYDQPAAHLPAHRATGRPRHQHRRRGGLHDRRRNRSSWQAGLIASGQMTEDRCSRTGNVGNSKANK